MTLRMLFRLIEKVIDHFKRESLAKKLYENRLMKKPKK